MEAQVQATVQEQLRAQTERIEQENARRWEAYAQYMQSLGYPQPPLSPFGPPPGARGGTPTPVSDFIAVYFHLL